MPTFMKGKKRNPWKGQVKRKGFKPEASYFATEDEAIKWEDNLRDKYNRLERGEFVSDPNDLRKVTIGDMIDRYLKEQTAYKASWRDETCRLEIFRNWNGIKDRSVLAFTRPDAIEYRNWLEREYQYTPKPFMRKGKLIKTSRKPKPIKAATVNKITAILRDMWNIAAMEWKGFESLQNRNPFSKVSANKPAKKRTRRLDDLPSRKLELDRLLEGCTHCLDSNKIYMPLGINLAIQTGMRLQEIINLRWNDIDIEQMTIDIKKSKTDHESDDDGRLIALTSAALEYLKEIIKKINPDITNYEMQFQRSERIFPMSINAFKQTWKRVCKYAGIASKEQDKAKGIRESQCGLEFKDLRREAGSWFDAAEISKPEHDIMLGHASKEMRGVYVIPYLNRVKKKLDAYWPTYIKKSILQKGAVSFNDDGTYVITPYEELGKGFKIRSLADIPPRHIELMSVEQIKRLEKRLAEYKRKREEESATAEIVKFKRQTI